MLIVDEDEIVRTVLATLLQSWNYTTTIARNLIGACHLVISDGPFDAIVCNYELPDGNAFDLFYWMQEQELEVPTIVPYGALRPMTAPQANVKLLEKPLDPAELRVAIEGARAGRRRRNVAVGCR